MATGPHKKRIQITFHELTADMLEMISNKTKLTKSQVIQQLLKAYTWDFWIDPNSELERWNGHAKKNKEQKKD